MTVANFVIADFLRIGFPWLLWLPLQMATDSAIAVTSYLAVGFVLIMCRRRPTAWPPDLLVSWALGLGLLGTVHLLAALPVEVNETIRVVADGGILVAVAAIAVTTLSHWSQLFAIGQPSVHEAVVEPLPDTSPQQGLPNDSSLALDPYFQSAQALLENSGVSRPLAISSQEDLATLLANLQETAERLNIALSAAQMGTWEWNLTTEDQVWSPRTQDLFGGLAPGEHPTYETWAKRVHPDDLPQVKAQIERARTHQQDIFVAEYRLQLPDTTRWVLSQGRLVSAAGEGAGRMIGVIQETTQEKRANLALAASEARFRAVFEQAAVGVARLSPAGEWLQVNETFCQLLGYPAAEVVGRHFREFTDPEDQAQDEQYYHQLMRREIDSCRFEKRYRHQDGTSIWTMVTVSTEQDEAHNIVALIAIIEDIQALKQTRLELQQRAGELERVNNLLAITNAMLKKRNAELDQFAYVASHDLKAPLRAIANLSEWIEEDLGSELPDENQHQLSLLRNRVHRMEALINGLLEYSRVGRRERRIETVDVRTLLSEVIELVVPPPSFAIMLPETLPTLQTNRTALGQVFNNLISNAIKHHDRDEGQIHITTRDRGDRVEFAVTDDGPGIDPQYHDRVFAIFQTLKSRDVLESTGIGLSLVKKIVEAEGGSVQLESALGEGSTFRFTWPKE